MSHPDLWILRHGETTWNRDGVLQGGRDAPLTARGRVQAARQGAILRAAGVAVPVRVSPLGRARRSAALAGLAGAAWPDLREVGLGAWEGRAVAALPHGPGHDWKFRAPGGETRAAFERRLAGVLAALDGPTVLVTHGVVATGLRAMLLGRDDWDGLEDRQGVVYALSGGRERVLG